MRALLSQQSHEPEGSEMSLFDMLKDKASELLQGASGKVSEVTGVDLPLGDVADQVSQATDGLGEAGQNVTDTATGSLGEATGQESER
jgi:hypothetical protein